MISRRKLKNATLNQLYCIIDLMEEEKSNVKTYAQICEKYLCEMFFVNILASVDD